MGATGSAILMPAMIAVGRMEDSAELDLGSPKSLGPSSRESGPGPFIAAKNDGRIQDPCDRVVPVLPNTRSRALMKSTLAGLPRILGATYRIGSSAPPARTAGRKHGGSIRGKA